MEKEIKKIKDEKEDTVESKQKELVQKESENDFFFDSDLDKEGAELFFLLTEKEREQKGRNDLIPYFIVRF
jgi:hypothetical protein